jgi:adenosine kinase
MGAVGNDKYAEILKEKAKEVGLKTLFQISESSPTAKCAVLLTDKNRFIIIYTV